MRRNMFEEDEEDVEAFSEDILKIIRELSSKNAKQFEQDKSPFPSQDKSAFHSSNQAPVSQAPLQPLSIMGNNPSLQDEEERASQPRKIVKLNDAGVGECKFKGQLYGQPRVIGTGDAQGSSVKQDALERLKEKNRRILELTEQASALKRKNQLAQQTYFQQKEAQKAELRRILKQSYELRLGFNAIARQLQKNQFLFQQQDQIPFLDCQIKALKNYEPKRNYKRGKNPHSDEEGRINEGDEKEKKMYVTAVASRLEKVKERLLIKGEGENDCIQEISTELEEKMKNCPSFREYVLLCKVKSENEQIQEILTMQLNTLGYEQLRIMGISPFTTLQAREAVCAGFMEAAKVARKLTPSTSNSIFSPTCSCPSLFVPISVVSFLDARKEEIVVGHEYPEKLQRLSVFLRKCDSGSADHSVIVRYICRTALQCLQEYRLKTGLWSVVLPSNIHFNAKYDVKMVGLPANNILMSTMRHLLVRSGEINYYPPEAIKGDFTNCAFWSVGILAYELSFSRKPFEDYISICGNSKEEFLILNELVFPPKTTEKCRQFIKAALSGGKDKLFAELLAHPFLAGK